MGIFVLTTAIPLVAIIIIVTAANARISSQDAIIDKLRKDRMVIQLESIELRAKLYHAKAETRALYEMLSNKDNITGNDLSKKEIRFILSRIHPDKNDNSEISTQVTAKLIKLSKGAS